MSRILQITEDHSAENTGITSAVDALVRQVQPVLPQTVLSTGSAAVPLPPGASGIQLPIGGGVRRAWRAASAAQVLSQQVQQADVVHLHGIWMWVQWAAARAAIQQHKPFLLSLHGMLEPWIWQRQHWIHQIKKKLYWQSVAYPVFQHASLIHAIHPREAQNLKTYFPTLPIRVISPSLDLQAIDHICASTAPDPNPEPYILFLGRIHPVKGIDLLIRAFAQLDTPGVRLKIAGPTSPRESAYADQVHKLVVDTGLEGRVEFLGAVQSHQKWDLLRNAWVFCLPSHSEVIGMVNLEAAACRTPVITTRATGIPPTWIEAGGFLVETSVTALADAMQQALQWTSQERCARGENLHHLIETTYSWKATSALWVELYQQLSGGA